MATPCSFDITSNVDLQEVDNALNQARKEVAQRYDFKGSKASIEFDAKESKLTLVADDDFKLNALWEIVQTRLVRRNVPVKNLSRGPALPAANSTVRQDIALQQGIPSEKAKDIVKFLKDAKLKKVQASIQGDQLRITSPSKDDLQEADAGPARAGFRRRAAVRELSRVADQGRPEGRPLPTTNYQPQLPTKKRGPGPPRVPSPGPAQAAWDLRRLSFRNSQCSSSRPSRGRADLSDRPLLFVSFVFRSRTVSTDARSAGSAARSPAPIARRLVSPGCQKRRSCPGTILIASLLNRL